MRKADSSPLLPLTSRHGNWASPEDSLGQFDKRLKTEMLPSHSTCSQMPFNALHSRGTGQEWLANHYRAECTYSAVKLLFRCHLLWEACQPGHPFTPRADNLYQPPIRWKVTIYSPVLSPKLDFELGLTEFAPLAPALRLAHMLALKA